MGFDVISYKVILTREEAISLLLDNQNVKATSIDGERLVLMGVRRVVTGEDIVNRGFYHEILTNVSFEDHESKYLWSTIKLTTKDKLTYHGEIFPNLL